MSDIRRWLEEHGLGQYADAFEAEQVSIANLADLTEDELKDLGLPLGPRKTVQKAARSLSAGAEQPRPDEAEITEVRRAAERRQLTVMFCDLVGSTELSGRLDAEDLRDVLHAYQNTVASEAARFEGHVAKYMGDGVLIYFGYPRAHEDDAERAARAGLDIAKAVGAINAAGIQDLQARIGISTGQVVVGDLIGEGAAQEEAVVGATPNLAARLQELAGPGAVVISQSTRRLLGQLFECEDLGEQQLKGIGGVRAWRVVREQAMESRFEARQAGGMTPFVGRDEEIGLLLGRWGAAKSGEGQVVLLEGEPGIGKSRITRTFRELISSEAHTRLRYQCSPYYTNSALYPFITQIERAAGFARGDDMNTRLDKLEAMLGDAAEATVAPLIAAMLSLDISRYPPLAMSPQKQKDETLKAIADEVTALAGEQPVLMIFEDAHWIDPTTQELLDLIVPLVAEHPVLLVITYRPEFTPPWTGLGQVVPVVLTRFGRAQAATMVARVTGDKALPDEVLDQIVAKTDGVPLFVEELTKTVLESGLVAEADGAYALTGPLTELAIPSSLQDSLMARLDRLSPVKEVAQIGACIGREFSYALLAAVSGLRDNELQNSLTELTNSALVFRRGNPPDATYTFKHALVQDVAYESLLRSTRQQLHTTIAQALEERFSDQLASEPELVAQHYTKAGLAEQAIPFWLRAGEHAVARFANQEAISHLKQGLELLARFPDTGERARHEIALRLALGPALIVIQGYGGPEIEANFKSLRATSERVADSAGLAAAFLGLHRYLVSSGEIIAAHEQDIEDFRLADSLCHNRLLTTARWALGASHLWLGNMAAARDLSNDAFRDLTFEDDQSFIISHLEAPGVTCRSFAANATLLLGYPQQALELVDDALNLSDRLGHPFVSAFAHFFAGLTHWLRREPRATLQAADTITALCAEHEMPLFPPMATIVRAWALVQLRAEAAMAELQLARESMSMVIPAWQPKLHPLVLDCELAVGSVAAGISALDKTLVRAEENGMRHSNAELSRLGGELALALPNGTESEAESWLRSALETARRQQAKWWELRAATSLAGLWRRQGKSVEARELLEPIFGWFTEGFDTADLKDAKALLEELQ